jgi:leucyl aminopeptidase
MEASYETYERIVDLPLWPEYSEQIKSTVADLKNLGGPYAGAQTAAAFLKEFTNYPWYHLDIAPYAFFDTNDKYRKQGATAAGVRLLYQFLQKLTQHESSSR